MASRIDGMVIAQGDLTQTAEQVLRLPYMGGPGTVPLSLYNSAAASSALTNTLTETVMDTYTLPANMLASGRRLVIKYKGTATATNGADTMTVKVYIGGVAGTALLTSTATDAVDADISGGEVELICRTAGASGTFIAGGSFTKVEAASGTASRVETLVASTAIDTTATQQICVSYKWSAASASDSARNEMFSVVLY